MGTVDITGNRAFSEYTQPIINVVFSDGHSELMDHSQLTPTGGVGGYETFQKSNVSTTSSENRVLTQDIGAEGGELVCTINWATAYMPDNVSAQADDDITSAAYDTGTPKNIRDLASGSSGINGGALEELVIQSWELNVSRTIERIHYADNTDGSYEPFGYAMTGGFEATGSMTVIRNDDVFDLIEGGEFHNSAAVDVNIQESSGFAIALDKCLLGESSIDNGGAVLMQTIPFTVVADDDISSTTKMIGISIA